jgi:5-methylcytosine-specific restriction enzyme subunit McrC
VPAPRLELGEWESGRIEGVKLSCSDRRTVEDLGRLRGDAAPDVSQDAAGVRVTARAGVGVVRFEEFELRIEPKLEGGDLGLFRMVEFAAGLQAVKPFRGRPGVRAEGLSLLDLVISFLVREASDLVRGGLRADYVERQDALPALRGRFLPDRQQLERFGLLDRVVCRFDEHEQDILDNRLIAAALLQAGLIVQDGALRRRVRSLAETLEEICDPLALDLEVDRGRLIYDRLNQHYRPAHELALLVLENVGPDELLRGGSTRSYSFVLNMNLLFEQFVTRVLEEAVDSGRFEVIPQLRSKSIIWRLDRDESYTSLVPDLLVQRRDRATARVPLDAKYKLYGAARKVDAGDLAQVFLYSYAYADPDAPEASVPPAAIIHPVRRPGSPEVFDLEVRREAGALQRAKLRVMGVHIPTLLDEVDAGEGPALAAMSEHVEGLFACDGPAPSG